MKDIVLLFLQMLNRFGNSSASMWSSSGGTEGGPNGPDQMSFDWNTGFTLRFVISVSVERILVDNCGGIRGSVEVEVMFLCVKLYAFLVCG